MDTDIRPKSILDSPERPVRQESTPENPERPLQNVPFQWGGGEAADSIRKFSSQELSNFVKEMLHDQNLENGVWIFGYGSLMWNPDFRVMESRTGVLSGYHRRLCLKSVVYRGTSDYHGLVFGLDRGEFCQGMVFRIAPQDMHSELHKVWEREMFADTYIPTWVEIETEDGNIPAITFVINPEHEHYAPDLPLEEVAERVIRAEGTRGSCHDYVQNTVSILHQLGLRDPSLEQLLTLIEFPQTSAKS